MHLSRALQIACEHHRAGRLDQAEEIYRRVLEAAPDHPEALHLLGAAALERSRPEDAIDYARRAIAHDDRQARYHNTLGEALRALGRLDEAVACYQAALQLAPNDPVSYNNLGLAREAQEQLDQAIACYQRAIELDPRLPQLHNNLGNALQDQGNLDRALACYRQSLALDPGHATAASNYLYALRYHPGATRAVLAEAHGQFDRRHAARFRDEWQPHANARDPDRPLRLGFVANRFSRGTVGTFLVRVLENLDPAEFSVWGYASLPATDDVGRRTHARAAGWLDTAALGDAELAARIRQDQVDVLFDLAGHAVGRRPFVLARKPAPIQIAWLDAVGSTGLSAMNYLLADARLVPPGAESDVAEQVLHMPDSAFCYDPPDTAPPVSPLPALVSGRVTFASFSRPAKIHLQVVRLWAKILKRLPDARLILKHHGLGSPGTVRRYQQMFANEGVSPTRIEFQGPSPPEGYLDQYRRVDLVLDPFPHSGGLTTCDALWLGVPVVTLPGETFASRQSLSLLTALGLTETIAANADDYVNRAVRLAQDPARLAHLRATLRARMATSPLCNGAAFAAHLAVVLRAAWRTWAMQTESKSGNRKAN